MEIFLSKDINISWHPGCFYEGGDNYSVGPIGRLGPGVTEEDLKKKITITKIPSSLVVYINTPTKELHDQFFDVLTKIKSDGDFIKIKEQKENRYQEIESIKPEHKGDILIIEKINKKNIENYEISCKKYESIGKECENKKINEPELLPIPHEYYNWKETIDYSISGFDVCSHEDTKFYKKIFYY